MSASPAAPSSFSLLCFSSSSLRALSVAWMFLSLYSIGRATSAMPVLHAIGAPSPTPSVSLLCRGARAKKAGPSSATPSAQARALPGWIRSAEKYSLSA
jgi:hypothetical protein